MSNLRKAAYRLTDNQQNYVRVKKDFRQSDNQKDVTSQSNFYTQIFTNARRLAPSTPRIPKKSDTPSNSTRTSCRNEINQSKKSNGKRSNKYDKHRASSNSRDGGQHKMNSSPKGLSKPPSPPRASPQVNHAIHQKISAERSHIWNGSQWKTTLIYKNDSSDEDESTVSSKLAQLSKNKVSPTESSDKKNKRTPNLKGHQNDKKKLTTVSIRFPHQNLKVEEIKEETESDDDDDEEEKNYEQEEHAKINQYRQMILDETDGKLLKAFVKLIEQKRQPKDNHSQGWAILRNNLDWKLVKLNEKNVKDIRGGQKQTD